MATAAMSSTETPVPTSTPVEGQSTPKPGETGSSGKRPEFWKPSRPAAQVHHLHKLEKKDSNSDLHSRLKSRKVLGVGETDDGDVHRSKLSQILGHSEQLQQRLPKGFGIWQALVIFHFVILGFSAMLFPGTAFAFLFGGELCDPLPYRLFGAAILSFALILWSGAYATTKDFTRWYLMAGGVYLVFHILLHIYSAYANEVIHSFVHKLFIVIEVAELGVTMLYYYRTGHRYRLSRPARRFSDERGRPSDNNTDCDSIRKKEM